jgi:hypothetical protein
VGRLKVFRYNLNKTTRRFLGIERPKRSYIPKRWKLVERNKQGNIVVAWTTDRYLAFDVDMKSGKKVIAWADEYGELHDLGSPLVMLSSEENQTDLEGNTDVNNYFVIFGKDGLNWEEICWHYGEAYRLGMINKKALDFRQLGTITLRYNLKNARKPYPTIVHFRKNGDSSGCMEYLRFWTANRYDGIIECSKESDKTSVPIDWTDWKDTTKELKGDGGD